MQSNKSIYSTQGDYCLFIQLLSSRHKITEKPKKKLSIYVIHGLIKRDIIIAVIINWSHFPVPLIMCEVKNSLRIARVSYDVCTSLLGCITFYRNAFLFCIPQWPWCLNCRYAQIQYCNYESIAVKHSQKWCSLNYFRQIFALSKNIPNKNWKSL
jgi:hypothetical protein